MPPDPAPYEPYYTSAQVCIAANISPSKLKNWMSRQPQVVLLDKEEREQVGRGHPILFSFNRVMQIALTAKMARLGLQPRQAAIAATGFSDMGDAGRDIGQLYPEGFTVLVVFEGDMEGELIGDCQNITMKTPAPMLWRGGMAGQRGAFAIHLVDVNSIHARVSAALRQLV